LVLATIVLIAVKAAILLSIFTPDCAYADFVSDIFSSLKSILEIKIGHQGRGAFSNEKSARPARPA